MRTYESRPARGRWAAPLLLLAVLVLAVPAAPAAALPSERDPLVTGTSTAPHVPLSGRTSIVSQGNGFLPIRLLQDVRVAASGPAPHPTVEVLGGGGFAGVAFVQDGVQNPAALLAGRLDKALSCESRCFSSSGGIVVRSQGLLRDGSNVSAAHVVPAGAYRLYVLSASGPVTVRLTFPEFGTGGAEQNLFAFTYTGATVSLPSNRIPVEEQRTAYAAGESGSIATSGLLFTYVEVVGESTQASQIYTCRYDGEEPAGAYLPGCAGGTLDASDPSVNPAAAPLGYRVTRHALAANVAPGTYGLGGGFVTASNSIETAHTVAVWLSY